MQRMGMARKEKLIGSGQPFSGPDEARGWTLE